jgi:hypothetical protein
VPTGPSSSSAGRTGVTRSAHVERVLYCLGYIVHCTLYTLVVYLLYSVHPGVGTRVHPSYLRPRRRTQVPGVPLCTWSTSLYLEYLTVPGVHHAALHGVPSVPSALVHDTLELPGVHPAVLYYALLHPTPQVRLNRGQEARVPGGTHTRGQEGHRVKGPLQVLLTPDTRHQTPDTRHQTPDT